jgi:ribonuclease P/MRP protein subunit POP1
MASRYESREDQGKWMETHLWQCKRMKMLQYWGYKIAYKCNERAERASYRFLLILRFAKNDCLLHDISYYGLIVIKGSSLDLIK